MIYTDSELNYSILQDVYYVEHMQTDVGKRCEYSVDQAYDDLVLTKE